MSGSTFGLKRFIFSRFMGSLSDQFLLFAVPLAIFKSTNDVKYSGLAFVIEWLPRIIFFPLAGFFVDRMKPRHLFFGVEFGRAAVLLTAFMLLLGGASTFVVLSVMMAFLSVAYVLNFVGTEAMLPRNLEASELPKAHSMLQSVEQTTMVAGPALAAALSIWGGLNHLLAISGIMFAISSFLLFSLKAKSVESGEKLGWAALRDSNLAGLRVLMENKVLFHLSGLTWIVNLIYGAALVVSAPIIVKEFGLPSTYFGGLQTAAAICSIVAFAYVPRFAAKFGLQVLGVTSFVAMILSGLWLASARQFELYLVGYITLMVFDGAFSVYIRSVRGQIIPKEHLGKTTGLIGLMNMCSIPMAGAVVTLMSGFLSPFGIFWMMFGLASVLGIILVLAGRAMFGYQTWLPSAPAAQATPAAQSA